MMHYILHLRPRSWLIVAFHFLVGALAAAGKSIVNESIPSNLAVGIILWSVCLNGGTLAFNSAFDKDKGDIGYLDSPPPIPKYLAHFGTFFMILGLLLSLWFLPIGFAAAYFVCVILSVLYSCPPIRLKAIAGFDVLINGVGYGGLTFLGGWLATGNTVTIKSSLLTLGFAFLFASFYPLTQIYQYAEDKRNKDKTLTVFLGPLSALHFSIIFNIISFLTFLIAVFLYKLSFVNFCLLLLPFFLWMLIIFPWLQNMDRYDSKKGMYRALKVWGITDFCIIFIFSDIISKFLK